MAAWMLALLWVAVVLGKDLTLEPGYLKPFGEGRLTQSVEELDYFPSAEEFFEKYVKPLKPVKMKGAAKLSAAFGKWTDDYFLAQDEPSDHQISVETKKKESRQQGVESMQFKDFVKMYNNTEHYMVDSVPEFLRHDLLIPCPLQCEQIMNNDFVANVMWYSSGGTKSVVHTDTEDNMSCLYRGDKSLVFVDPAKYGDKVDLDRLHGSYSSMDVDSVDYTMYPGMADVEFYHVNITAGDCLYIPYLWIHQVRSYGSNIAVNVWWNHDLSNDMDYSECSDPCSLEMTLDDADFQGFGGTRSEAYKNEFMSIMGNEDRIKVKKLVKALFGDDIDAMLSIPSIEDRVIEIFSLLDVNADSVITREELEKASEEIWTHISYTLISIQLDIDSLEWEQENDNAQHTAESGDALNELHDEL